MIAQAFLKLLLVSSVALLLIAFLFTGEAWSPFPTFTDAVLKYVANAFEDLQIRWVALVCLEINFVAIIILRFYQNPDNLYVATVDIWLVYVMLVNAVVCAFQHSPSVQAIIFLATAVIGKCFALYLNYKSKSGLRICVTYILILLLAMSSFCQSSIVTDFGYLGYSRWLGPWDSPNVAGALMGVGTVLAVGIGIQVWSMNNKLSVKISSEIICLITAIMCFNGLLKSYSRGAWLGLLCGTFYFVFKTFKSSKMRVSDHRLRYTIVPLVFIVLSTLILAFWHFQQIKFQLVHRTFSIANANDFSWRNRIAAWEGVLQITAEYPWFGAGWSQPELLYENYYLSPKIIESAAIGMNNYLMISAKLGILSLFCFGMYVWLSFVQNVGIRNQKLGVVSKDSGFYDVGRQKIICHAGAVVLLVGFWFDGGLFRLATASIFWILLELGSS